MCRPPGSSFLGLGLLFGDSIVANVFADAPSVVTLTAGGLLVANQAVSGHTISQQETAWNSNYLKGRRECTWGIVQVGINDIINGVSLATMTAAHTALVNNIITANPLMKLILSLCAPARTAAAMSGAEFIVWGGFNAYLLAYPTAETNIVINSGATAALDDGTGALNAGDDSGDHLHPNATGSGKQSTSWRASLDS